VFCWLLLLLVALRDNDVIVMRWRRAALMRALIRRTGDDHTLVSGDTVHTARFTNNMRDLTVVN